MGDGLCCCFVSVDEVCVELLCGVIVFFFFLMIRRPPRSTQSRSSAASDVYKRQVELRLWHALDLQLLAPFEYYACDDATDFSAVPWDLSLIHISEPTRPY